MTKAFGYIRVSGDSQIDGDGFPRQLAAIKAYAAAHDIRIVKVFREEGVSGIREAKDRPAWAEMMLALLGNGVKTVIIERLDRLARELMVQEKTIADLQKQNFNLVSVQEPDLMSGDPSRIAFRQMMGVFAEYDKSQIVLKLRAARMRKKAKDGRCEGRKPYGFYQGEMEPLDRMKTLRATGLGFDRIAAQLNAEGLTPRSGTRWHGVVVNRILTGKPLR
ncbi:MAG TPA: recombinase family protein [Bryobacteraceae bacterium]|nr:recombinase family protein [Bryobacteraceae bacterium]